MIPPPPLRMTFLFLFFFLFPSKASRLGARADTVVQRRANRAERPADESPQRVASLPLLPLQTLARRRLPRVHRYVLISGRVLLFLFSCNVRLHLLLFSFYSLPLFFAVFIYSMPGYKCSIRDRMLYSSCKNPLVDMVENDFKIEIEKKVRADLWHAVRHHRSNLMPQTLTQTASVFVQLGLCTCECRGVGRHQSHWKSFEKKSNIRKQNCWNWKSVSDWPNIFSCYFDKQPHVSSVTMLRCLDFIILDTRLENASFNCRKSELLLFKWVKTLQNTNGLIWF